MKFCEKAAKTIDDAIEEALRELQITRDQVDIVVLDEGSKGLFGILGTKLARVRVSVKENMTAEKAKNFLSNLLSTMEISAEIDAQYEGETLFINLTGKNLGVLIGKHGQTLDSLQYLVSLVANKGLKEGDNRVRIIVDAEGYRKRREETLRSLALRLAEKVRRDGRSASLEPMTAGERRIIHTALQHNSYVSTHSEGEEPNRRIVITPKSSSRPRQQQTIH
jgi:spoIIIJ-associated protein